MKKLVLILSICLIACTHSKTKDESYKQETKISITDSANIPIDSLTSDSVNEDQTSTIHTFIFCDELCIYTCKYDSTKYTSKQLKNTYDLYCSFRFEIKTDYSTFSFNQIDKLDVNKLDQEYNQKVQELKILDIVPIRYFEKFRQEKLHELLQVYKLGRLHLLGYSNPSVLDYEGCPAKCKKYAQALTQGGDNLLQAWKDWNEEHTEQQRRIGNSESNLRRMDADFYEKYNSPNKMEYARMDVINFGWWNTANHTIERPQTDDFMNNYLNLFIQVKTECDEP